MLRRLSITALAALLLLVIACDDDTTASRPPPLSTAVLAPDPGVWAVAARCGAQLSFLAEDLDHRTRW
jgi:hypothetical protein